MTPEILTGRDRQVAAEIITRAHYTKSVPSGKSHYIKFNAALVVWSIPANKNLARFLGGKNVWELSRLWAPDGHAPNLLTQAISAGVKAIIILENPDILVSYADPNVGHSGGVYKAASWIYHGRSEEARAYRNAAGDVFARRKFHSGKRGMSKTQIEALGFVELRLPGKIRFIKPLSRAAKKRFSSAASAAYPTAAQASSPAPEGP